ncbi:MULTISPECIES: ABC transporter ATP-binding protein [Actinomyces]|nr:MULTISPECIES: ABC transporter ATP-binding protein [Actinomyces]
MIRRLQRCLGTSSNLVPLMVAHVIAGVCQGVSLVLLVPFLRAFLAGEPSGGWLAAVVITALLGLTISGVATVRSYAVACYDVCGSLVRTLGHRVQQLPLGWFTSATTGQVATAVSRDTANLSHLPSIALPQIASMSGSAAVIGVSALFMEWRMGIALLLALPGTLLCLRWLRRAVRGEFAISQAAAETLGARLLEFSRLQAVLRATGAVSSGVSAKVADGVGSSSSVGGSEVADGASTGGGVGSTGGTWAPLEAALREDHVASGRAQSAKGPAGQAFHTWVETGIVASLTVGLYLLLGGALDPAVFITLALMVIRFAEPVGMLAFYVDPLHQSDVALERIESILDAPALPEPAQERVASPRPSADGGLEVSLDHVTFGYVPGRDVIHDVTLTFPARSVTALVGPSGSGKSTLTRLVARFWDVSSGTVRVGGEDVRDLRTQDLMEQVSMVFQDVYLFDTTIEENVRIGRADATDEEVRAAAERAGLSEVVERLPHGWATQVGEGGSSLSGGERQRVAIARAFLKDAPVLLLDEVTSALDGVSEAGVTRAMEELSQGRTVLVIAHRLSTIRRADRIVVLVDGAVEAVGTHDELYEAGGTYRSFWDDQSAVDRWRLVGSGTPEA